MKSLPIVFRPFHIHLPLIAALLACVAAGNPARGADLLVSDFDHTVIERVTPGGAVSAFSTDVTAPVGLVFDHAGNLYAADDGTGEVLRFTPGGARTVFASLAADVYGLACDRADNVYVAVVDSAGSGSVVKITPAGARSNFATGLGSLRGLAFDSSDRLYAAENANGIVDRFTPAGVKSVFASGLGKPIGLTVDLDGNVFVGCRSAGILKITPAGAVGTFTNNVTDARYLAFDANGYLYASDDGDNSGTQGQGNVYRFTRAGARTTVASNLYYPTGLAFVPGAPVIANAPTATATVNKAFTLRIKASDRPTRYGVVGLPPGLHVDAASGVISGTPTATGKRMLTLKAANTFGTGEKMLTLTINPALPVVTSPATATATVGKAFSYQITATNSPTRFGVVGLPPGLSVNATTGLISGAPTKVGTPSLMLKATNAGGTGQATLKLTIKAN